MVCDPTSEVGALSPTGLGMSALSVPAPERRAAEAVLVNAPLSGPGGHAHDPSLLAPVLARLARTAPPS